ncbi:uncharacterized mitochondrial protein AtMg00810-like [Rutidosis leptorrhynchoides]|uniref:uncharacterized mitochondrial protein AtMg00810-like n=1 Tax=Rutidosis leptorrhynchoides TaxID=125765 RepID=UPI003A995F35
MKGVQGENEESFDMSDLGELNYYLGIEVKQKETGFELSQVGYAKRILSMARMIDCYPVRYPMESKFKLSKDVEGNSVDETNYRRLIGCLRYLVHTRPDLAYAVGVVSRYMHSLKGRHLKAGKQILRYVKGTLNFGIVYKKWSDERLIGYSNNSHGMDLDDGRETTGVVFYLGFNMIT